MHFDVCIFLCLGKSFIFSFVSWNMIICCIFWLYIMCLLQHVHFSKVLKSFFHCPVIIILVYQPYLVLDIALSMHIGDILTASLHSPSWNPFQDFKLCVRVEFFQFDKLFVIVPSLPDHTQMYFLASAAQAS